MRSRHFRLGLLRRFVTFATSVFLMAGVWAQSTSGAVHQHAHVHGVAKPGIAMQGTGPTLSFESPPDSLVGFEHRPLRESFMRVLLEACRRAGSALIFVSHDARLAPRFLRHVDPAAINAASSVASATEAA